MCSSCFASHFSITSSLSVRVCFLLRERPGFCLPISWSWRMWESRMEGDSPVRLSLLLCIPWWRSVQSASLFYQVRTAKRAWQCAAYSKQLELIYVQYVNDLNISFNILATDNMHWQHFKKPNPSLIYFSNIQLNFSEYNRKDFETSGLV